MIRHDGYAKVVDFGLVKLTETPQSEAGTELPTQALRQTDTGLTDLLRTRQRLETAAPSPAKIEAARKKAPPAPPEIEPTEKLVQEATKESETALLFSTSTAPRRSWLVPAVIVLLLAGGLVGGYVYFGTKTAEKQIKPQPTQSSLEVRTTQLTTWAGLDFHPSFSPDGGSIAYSSDRTGSFEIYVKQLTPGSSEIQLTNGGEQNFEPAWSPDGKLVAYHSKLRGGIWLVPALGGPSKQLTEFGSYPAWSSDGSQIAFQSTGIGDDLGSISSGALLPSTIWTVSAQGGEPKQITKVGSPAGGHGSPSWSADGKRIAFGCYDPERSDIWSVTLEGGQPTFIAKGVEPTYAPDGESIYFVSIGENLNLGISNIRVSDAGEPSGEPVQIATTGTARVKRLSISADGKKLSYSALSLKSNLLAVPVSPQTQEPLGPPVALTQDTSYRNSHPNFSPDGSKIAFHVRRVGVNQDIWLLEETGSAPLQLTTNPHRDERPSWFPGGDRIAFISFRGRRQELWTVDLKSRRETPLLEIQQDMTFPHLSPDGKQILFNSKKSGITNLWLVPSRGRRTETIDF